MIQKGVVIRKCDVAGNEIGGASLKVEDLNGNLMDSWISVERQSHSITNVQVGMVYRLTETLAPADFAIAAPVFFRLESDDTVTILIYGLTEDGEFDLINGQPYVLRTYAQSDNVVTMIDEYTGSSIVTSSTSQTTVTTKTTTTKKTTASTTTGRNSSVNNGNHTPSPHETTETTVVSGDSSNGTSQNGGTTAGGPGTTVTVSVTTNRASSSGNTNVNVSPKTDDPIVAILIPASAALLGILYACGKRRKK